MILIIACGNSLRRDDGAGRVLAAALRRRLSDRNRDGGVKLVCVRQLTPELAELVAGGNVSAVVFVDTRAVSPTNDSLAIEAAPLLADGSSRVLGHHFGASALMMYARYLFGKAPPAWLMTIPGVDFGHGEGLSGTALKALTTLPRVLSGLPEGWPLRTGSWSFQDPAPKPELGSRRNRAGACSR